MKRSYNQAALCGIVATAILSGACTPKQAKQEPAGIYHPCAEFEITLLKGKDEKQLASEKSVLLEKRKGCDEGAEFSVFLVTAMLERHIPITSSELVAQLGQKWCNQNFKGKSAEGCSVGVNNSAKKAPFITALYQPESPSSRGASTADLKAAYTVAAQLEKSVRKSRADLETATQQIRDYQNSVDGLERVKAELTSAQESLRRQEVRTKELTDRRASILADQEKAHKDLSASSIALKTAEGSIGPAERKYEKEKSVYEALVRKNSDLNGTYRETLNKYTSQEIEISNLPGETRRLMGDTLTVGSNTIEIKERIVEARKELSQKKEKIQALEKEKLNPGPGGL